MKPPGRPNFYGREVAERFDRTRGWSDSREVPRRIASVVRLGPDAPVLDVGCGTGNLMRALTSQTGCAATGVDLSGEMLARAHAKDRLLRLVRGDAAALPFAAESFDAVVGAFFLHHVPDDLRPRAVAQCARVVGRGGCVAIVTRSHEHLRAGGIARFFPEVGQIDAARFPRLDRIRDWMRDAGLSDVAHEAVTESPVRIDEAFVKWVRQRPISTLDLIGDAALKQGLLRLEHHVERTRRAPESVATPFDLVYGRKPS